jgi:5'-methylthioadenosine nucleosidase
MGLLRTVYAKFFFYDPLIRFSPLFLLFINRKAMEINHISILMAMESEASPLIESLNLKKQNSIFRHGIPFEAYQGSFEKLLITLMTSGKDKDYQVDNVATQPATLMAYLAIDQFSPDIIINAGTAGGMAGCGCKIGDVYLSEGEFSYHDRRIPIPAFDQYGVGSYPSFDTSSIATELHLKTGRISTGNSLDYTEKDLEMMKSNKAVIKEMEAAAIAWVCKILDMPMFAIKAITDLFDQEIPTETQFLENLTLASTNLQKSVPRILRTLVR